MGELAAQPSERAKPNRFPALSVTYGDSSPKGGAMHA